MSWEALLGLVTSVLPIIDLRKERDHEMATAALEALGDAFHSTVIYYETECTSDYDRRRAQIELADKWDRVANRMRPFSKNLWSRFNLKSRFWYEGEAWKDEQIESANIGLEKVRKDARFELIPRQIQC